MQTQKILVALTVLVSLSLASCASSKLLADTSTDTIKNTSWSLVSLPNQSLAPNTLITLNVDNDKITGTDGCNRYNALYVLNEDTLNINKNIATTMMACPEPIMQQAASYTGALAQTTSYKIEGSQLILLDTEGKPLATFNRQRLELSGTSWRVTNINNGKQAVASLINGSTVTLDFGSDGKLNGFAGCNKYMSSYKVTGKSINIKPAAATRKMCGEPAGIMDQETQFLNALATVVTYRLDGNRLELRTADNALAVMLISH
jgi:heat shock protein HslJ